jgi:hypothetical protein
LNQPIPILPNKIPVPLKKTLLGLMRQKRQPDRVHLFRHYLRDSFQTGFLNVSENPESNSVSTFIRDESEQIELADKEMERLDKNGLNADEYVRHMAGFGNVRKCRHESFCSTLEPRFFCIR